MLMILFELFSWWYTTGWMRLIHGAGARTGAVLDFFSVGTLLQTLFDPFRQIDAGKVRGSMQAELQAFGNRLFSRIIGFFIRTITIISGLISAVVVMIVGLLQLILWPLLPLAPIVGLVATLSGWTVWGWTI